LPDSTNFSGANSSKLTILNASQADAGSYQLVITNAAGKATTTHATVILQSPALVGEWLDGTDAATNFVDVSGYSLAAAHPGYLVGLGSLVFTNDVPLGKTGQSLLFDGYTGIAISNSSTLDVSYDNTFDDRINNVFTITCWAKGFPPGWSPWVSKFGEGEAGWQLRVDGSSPNDACFTIRNNGVGVATLGNGTDDLGTRTMPSNDGGWHLYVGVFNGGTGVRKLYVDAVLAAGQHLWQLLHIPALRRAHL
jgi:hypothetical protein